MKIVIGTRGSKLALVQSRAVAQMLYSAGADVEIRPIRTVGDTLDVALTELGGKGVFVKEIDDALLSGDIDCAVHSMKDVPSSLPAGIGIAAVPAREDARDSFVSTLAFKLTGLPKGARVGTSSPRRRAQIFRIRPDLKVLPMRGNVETRLKKLGAGEVDAVILAAAGLKRLGIESVITELLPTDRMIPAIGQGALAVAVRRNDRERLAFVSKVCHNAATGLAVRAERTILKALGGDCHTPLAAHAEIRPSGIFISAFMATKDEARAVVEHESGPADQAAEIGKRLADKVAEKLGCK
ncbi:MAG TPA: hydroxymethylbilane synthase [bacterium]|nr:hydroxymethylbilane synthase [bacterium]